MYPALMAIPSGSTRSNLKKQHIVQEIQAIIVKFNCVNITDVWSCNEKVNKCKKKVCNKRVPDVKLSKNKKFLKSQLIESVIYLTEGINSNKT